MPRGASQKREREYEKLKGEATRIVNKQRAQQGETRGSRAKAAQGRSKKGLPLPDYDTLTVQDIVRRLERLSPEKSRQINQYERRHRRRKGLLEVLNRRERGEAPRRRGAKA